MAEEHGWSEDEVTTRGIRPGKGRGATKFAYTFQTLADLTKLKVGTVRKHARSKVFDPKSLESVIEYICKYR